MLPQTKMATETEVEGETTVSVPSSVEQEINDYAKEHAQDDEKGNTRPPETPEEGKTEVTESGDDHLSERHEKRAGQLVNKLKSVTEEKEKAVKELSALRTQLEREKTTPPLRDNFAIPPWEQSPIIPENGEITQEQYQSNVMSTADNIVKARFGQFTKEFSRLNSFESDLHEVERKYPIFNEDSEKFDPSRTQKFVQKYNELRIKDPDLRLKDFAETIMSFHQAGQEEGQQAVTKKMIQQESSEVVPPSSSAKVSKGNISTEGMSDSEMEAYLKETGEWDRNKA